MRSVVCFLVCTAFAREADSREPLRLLASSLLSLGASRGRSQVRVPARRADARMDVNRRKALAVALALGSGPLAAGAVTDVYAKDFTVLADSLIPIVRDLQAKTVGPLAGKAVKAAVTGNPKEIVKTINLGLDAILSIPPERFYVSAELLKEGTALAAKAESCNLVCLPPKEKTEEVARSIAEALSLADPVKLQAFLKQAGISFASGDPKQYAAASGDLVKFFLALDKNDFNQAKDAALAIVKSISMAEDYATKFGETFGDASAEKKFKYTQNGRVEVVAEELADALYPIVKGVKAEDVGPFASKLVELGATGDPKEIIKTIDAGLDALLSVSQDRLFAAIRALKDAVGAAVDAPTCNLICVAPKDTVLKFTRQASTALSTADPVKLKAFVDQALKSFETGDKEKYVAAAAAGKKFLKALNPNDVQRVKAASLDLLKASGSELYTDVNWGYSDV
mmetsp:Transcript_87052/g.137393  ORF Transcript_87052/g.137393 Transcript_87052/m.137393 type:complete len:454 (+) Transcript_87052:55-1416(+)